MTMRAELISLIHSRVRSKLGRDADENLTENVLFHGALWETFCDLSDQEWSMVIRAAVAVPQDDGRVLLSAPLAMALGMLPQVRRLNS
jgi:hypothetical protein